MWHVLGVMHALVVVICLIWALQLVDSICVVWDTCSMQQAIVHQQAST